MSTRGDSDYAKFVYYGYACEVIQGGQEVGGHFVCYVSLPDNHPYVGLAETFPVIKSLRVPNGVRWCGNIAGKWTIAYDTAPINDFERVLLHAYDLINQLRRA